MAFSTFAQSPTPKPNEATESFIARLLAAPDAASRANLLAAETKIPLAELRKALVAGGDELPFGR